MNKKENIKRQKFDSTIQLADNALLKARPDLFDEWDFEKNDELGLNIYNITKGMHKVVWWKCLKCGSSYDTTAANRINNNCNCSFCSGKRVNHTNSLASLNISLAKEWHPTKNGELTPHSVTSKSGKKVWWQCDYGHEWDASIISRGRNGCPICGNKKVLIGFNDIWTTNPEMAKLLLNPEDGYRHTQASGKKVDWKCLDCEYVTKNKPIFRMLEDLTICKSCSDGFKFPEKFMLNLLLQLQVEFIRQKSFNWLKEKKYDFYIPSLNMIIETHGGQHYKIQGYVSVGGRTLEEEQSNDRLKKIMAKKNGVVNYIEVDCRKSTLKHIKKSILGTNLTYFFDLGKINWELIVKNAQNSKIVQACEFYSIHKYELTYAEMANILDIHLSTLKDYLVQGSQIGLCEYETNNKKRNKIATKHKVRAIVQLNPEGNFIVEWESIADIARHFNKKDCSSISGCCKGRNKTAYGYKWMYKEDYEELNIAI
jgi:hypothetical protein